MSEKSLSIDRLPGSYENRVFVGGNYDLLPLLRQIQRYVTQVGLVPLLAFDFDVPKEAIHDFDLRLLHNCRHAIFEVTISAGELMELGRAARDYGANVYAVYQVRDPERREVPAQVSNMVTSLGVKMFGYSTLEELEQFIIDELSKVKGAILIGPPAGRLDFSVGLLMEEIGIFRSAFRDLEVDVKRERDGIAFGFMIDYSLVHNMLYAGIADLSHLLEDTGLVNFMFDRKRESDAYILPPPSAWEMLNRMERAAKLARRYANYQNLVKDPGVSGFFKILKSPPQDLETLYSQLSGAYARMGGLRELVALLVPSETNQLHSAARRIESLVAQRKLIPLEEAAPEYERYCPHQETYLTLIHYLSQVRPTVHDNNTVDALNMSLTYALTDSLYPTENKYFVLTTNSRIPFGIFNRIKWQKDPLQLYSLVRQPTFMALRILLSERPPDSVHTIGYLSEGRHIMDRLWRSKDMFGYSDRLVDAFERDEKSFITQELVPLARALEQFELYREKVFPLIRKIMGINIAEIKGMRLSAGGRAKEFLSILESKEEYENRMINAAERIGETMRETYMILRRFADMRYKHLMTPEMLDLFERIE